MLGDPNMDGQDDYGKDDDGFGVVELMLTPEQHILLQYLLPKKYVLLPVDSKSNKRGVQSSAVKQNLDDNTSRFSTQQNNEEELDRSKRPRTKKKMEMYEDQGPLRIQKKLSQQKVVIPEQFANCFILLQLLKAHKYAGPFLQPVDPKRDNALDYLDIITEPMDLSTVESKLKENSYASVNQFHADISKIWSNSYRYNDKTSEIHRFTQQVSAYYETLRNKYSANPKPQKIKMKAQTKPQKDKVGKNADQDQQNEAENDKRQYNSQDDEFIGSPQQSSFPTTRGH